jgi:uncharacterized membrane protein
MDSSAVHSTGPIDAGVSRGAPPLPALIQLGLIGSLFALAAVAWLVTGEQMSGMDAGPGTDPGTLGFFLGVWVVMMAAMMFPSIAPMVVMYARMQEGRREQGHSAAVGATALFIGGYLVAWTAAGLGAYAIYELGSALTGDLFAWDNAGPYLAGAVIVGAIAAAPSPSSCVTGVPAAPGRCAWGRSTVAGASAAAGR